MKNILFQKKGMRNYWLCFPIIAVLVFFDFNLNAQNTNDSKKTLYLSKNGFNRLVNKSFSGIVSGQSTGTTIANYASLDPTNGSVMFKGSIPITLNKDSARFSFLTFKLSGDLISDNYTVLFNNSVKNTNTVFEAQYHIRFRKGVKVRYLGSDEIILNYKRERIESEREKSIKNLFSDSARLCIQRNLNSIKLYIKQKELEKSKDQYEKIDLSLKNVFYTNKANSQEIKRLYDTLAIVQKSTEALAKEVSSISIKIDSMDYAIDNSFLLRQNSKGKLINRYKKEIQNLESNAPYTAIQYSWFSFTGGFSRKNYYTFDASSSFGDQIAKNDLTTAKAGITFNFYHEKSFPRKIMLLNVGGLWYKDNNTSLLSTQEIVQVKTIKNITADTARTITRKYNAYTDPIYEYNVWSFFSNLYLIHSSKTFAFHIFPSVDIYKGGNTITNIGLGYIVSFKSQKKPEQSIINAEGYIQFNDLFNDMDDGSKFWNRNIIGVRFTIPFNLLTL